MKNGLTEIVFILDKSGSMGGLEKDTIGGFNSMLGKQKEVEGEALVTTVLFDSNVNVIHNRQEVHSVPEMTSAEYCVGGCTALLDAVGSTIKMINTAQKAVPEEERPEKTMFVITTDGFENSSHMYSYEKVKKMISKKQDKKNWEFLFLGANIDAAKVAGDIGIRQDRAVNYHSDHVGTALNYRTLGKAITGFRKAAPGVQASMALANWDEDIAEDYNARK